MQQHINLGKTLRKRYVDDMGFLSKTYQSHEIYVRSTGEFYLLNFVLFMIKMSKIVFLALFAVGGAF